MELDHKDLAQGVRKPVTEAESKYNIQDSQKWFYPTMYYLFIEHVIIFSSNLLLKRV